VACLVFAALYTGLLGISFSGGLRHMRRVRKNLPHLQDTDDEWRRRALNVVLLGTGDVTIGARITLSAGTSTQLVLRATNGIDISVPEGTYIQVAARAVRVIDQRFVAHAGTGLTAYVSSYVPDDGVLRSAWQLAPGTKLILVDRGAAPVAETIARWQRTWRPGRVALIVGGAAALIGAVAASPAVAWLAALGVIVLAVDVCFFHGAMIMLTCTRQRELPSRTS
jgi:hypothetical protein